jgi:hypothetical protein
MLTIGRRATLLLLLAAGARAAEGRVLRAAPEAVMRGPGRAAGALIWAHAHYTEGPPPSLPPFAGRLAEYDLWRLDRVGSRDPLDAGAAALAEGCGRLRAEGYRQVAILGESRGAFIALAALATPRLADAMLLLAPAAHGMSPARRPEALAAFRAALDAMAPDALRRGGLALFRDDPYDPDPEARAAAFREAMQRRAVQALVIDRPDAPTGHGAARDPAFDARFGACLAAFLTGQDGSHG